MTRSGSKGRHINQKLLRLFALKTQIFTVEKLDY